MIRHKRFLIGLALFSGIAGLATIPAFPQIATPIASIVPARPAAVPFELYRGNRIILAGRVNQVDTPLMLDSGAGVTTLDKAFAQKMGLKDGQKITAQGTGGTQDAELFHDVTIEVGNLKLSGVTVVAIDLSRIEKAIGRPMPVVLGRELFMNSIVQVDFDQGLMTLSPAKDFVAPAGAAEVKLKREGTLHFIPVSIDGLPPVDAAFDLGNGGAISVSKEYHQGNPQFASLPYAIGMGGGVGGVHEMKRVTLPKVAIAGFEFDNVPADLGSLEDGPYEGRANAGIQMFRPFRLTLDLGHDRLWLQRTSRPAVFPKDRSGLFTLLEDDHLNILHVSPGSPADKAGLKKGDRISAIGGHRAGPDFYKTAQANWSRAPAGTAVALQLDNGRTVTLTLADYF
jgi:hypothetical protein